MLKWTAEPFMRPEAEFEVNGFVPNVVFPTGVVQDGETLLVYYGAADAVTAVAEFSTAGVADGDGRGGVSVAGQVARLRSHARVIAFSTSSSGTVANVLA